MFGTNVDAFVALIAMAVAPHVHDTGANAKAVVVPAPPAQERVITTAPGQLPVKVIAPASRKVPTDR